MLEIKVEEKLKVEIRENEIYSQLRNKWLVNTPEERVRQEFVCHLVNNYGYHLDQMEEELQVNNSQRGQGKSRADIVIWLSKKDKQAKNSAFIVVECKSDKVKIHSQDYYQGNNYASWANAKFFVTHNNFETKYFQMMDKKMPVDLNEIIDIPHFKDVDNAKKLKELTEATKVFTRDEFSKLLLTCHNVIRNNDSLDPAEAFDEISKILFIKIRYERSKSKQKFSKDKFNDLKKGYLETVSKNAKPFYQNLFDQTKEDFEKDQLFEPNEQIKIKEDSFEKIVGLLEKYDLSNTSDDIKGIAFEQFLGRTFRGELGQFFTPRTIVDFMVDILDPQEGQVICDPCCGSGGFLIKAFEYVKSKIELDIFNQKEVIKKEYFNNKYEKLNEVEKAIIDNIVEQEFKELNKTLDNTKEGTRMYKLSHDCIYGSDANPRMARVSKMNMIMHGDGHGGVHHNDGLLNVNEIFENRFDIILTNPPFGGRIAKDHKITTGDNKYTDKIIEGLKAKYGNVVDTVVSQIEKNIGEPLLKLYDTGSMSTLTEVLFMERYLKLLKKGGKMAVVLPEGFLNNPNLQKVREYFEGRAKIILITSIPSDVFIASGANVKPSLVFLQKFTEEEEKEHTKVVDKIARELIQRDQEQTHKLATESKNLKGEERKAKLAELKNLITQTGDEIKKAIKEEFNYQIPIVEVEKAGITTTGQTCENELLEVLKEWREYNKVK